MLEPLVDKARRGMVAKTKFCPPPTDGWNATDDVTGMKKKDAVALINAMATSSGVTLRKGQAEHATGIEAASAEAPVLSLMVYSPQGGNVEKFAASADAIYDVTAAGAVGAAAVSSLNSGFWQSLMFATTGGSFLIAANGVDAVRNYDGSSWTTPTIQDGAGSAYNLASTNSLIAPTLHMARVWFIEQGSLRVWYLEALAIQGDAFPIDFGPLSALGGELIALASWTRDGGAGMDDVMCFITSEGEVHIYAGTDPDSDATWTRVGTFRIAKPLGKNCIIKAGADIGVLTEAGLLPLSAVLPLSAGGQAKAAATQRIDKAFLEAAAAYSSNTGWQVLESPDDKLLIVNVPLQENAMQEQYVAYEGKWARWRGINATCWAVADGRLYFGTNDGRVMTYEGGSDEGEAIDATILHAFWDLGDDAVKVFRRIMPLFIAPPGYRPRVALRVEYDDSNVVDFSAQSAIDTEGTPWDEGTWDEAEWAPGARQSAQWQGCSGRGRACAPIIAISSTEPVTYNGSRVLYERGYGV